MALKLGIVGANGFVGSRAVERSVLEGEFLAVPIVRSQAGRVRAARFPIECRVADAFDAPALAAALAGCDAVLHSLVADAKQMVRAARALGEACAIAEVRRVVYLSSASIFGQNPGAPLTAQSRVPRTHLVEYNGAKARAEEILFSQADRRGLELIALRPSVVWGPRSSWVASFVDDLLAGKSYLVEGGVGVCNSVYVDNLIDAVVLAAQPDRFVRGAFFVCDDHPVSWRQFFTPFAEAVGKRIQDVPTVPRVAQPSSRPDYLSALRSSRAAPLAKRILGQRTFTFLRGGRTALLVPPEPSAFIPRHTESAAPTFEVSELQTCMEPISDARTREQLDYQPRVTIAEGTRRTIAWLEFAGYPVVGPRTSSRHASQDETATIGE